MEPINNFVSISQPSPVLSENKQPELLIKILWRFFLLLEGVALLLILPALFNPLYVVFALAGGQFIPVLGRIILSLLMVVSFFEIRKKLLSPNILTYLIIGSIIPLIVLVPSAYKLFKSKESSALHSSATKTVFLQVCLTNFPITMVDQKVAWVYFDSATSSVPTKAFEFSYPKADTVDYRCEISERVCDEGVACLATKKKLSTKDEADASEAEFNKKYLDRDRVVVKIETNDQGRDFAGFKSSFTKKYEEFVKENNASLHDEVILNSKYTYVQSDAALPVDPVDFYIHNRSVHNTLSLFRKNKKQAEQTYFEEGSSDIGFTLYINKYLKTTGLDFSFSDEGWHLEVSPVNLESRATTTESCLANKPGMVKPDCGVYKFICPYFNYQNLSKLKGCEVYLQR